MPTQVSDLGDTIDTIHQKATQSRMFNAVMSGLAWTIRQDKGSSVNVPYFNTAVSRQLTEGVDNIIEEIMTDTNVAVTFYEAGLKGILTDDVIEDNNEDLISAMGTWVGNAYETKLDQDLLAKLDEAASSLAAAGSTLTLGHLAAGRATLMGNAITLGGAAPPPHVCILHPFQQLDLVDVLTPIIGNTGTAGFQAFASPLADRVIQNYAEARFFGMPVVIDGNLTIDASDDVKGGIFSASAPGGIIYAPRRQPTIRPERDESLRGVEINYYGRYGVSIFRSGWVVELYSDASSPA